MSDTNGKTALGVLYNVLASVLFAVMYGYTSLLTPMDAEEIYGWRTLLTLPCLTVLVITTGHWGEVKTIFSRLRQERWFWAKRVLSSVLLNAQLWLFMWAPVNGHALDVSLGYFLLPITTAVVGRVVFKDKLSRFQLLACALAALGVLNELVVAKEIAWPAFAVCAGYPMYYVWRRLIGTNNLGGLWFDLGLTLPVSLYFITHGSFLGSWDGDARLPLLIVGLGAISATALSLSALSAPRLNLSLYGLLTYVEPILMVCVALLLGEVIKPTQWPTYLAIGAAVLALCLEGVLSIRNTVRHRRLNETMPPSS
ncbi:chloramphenicol-sensitive protein RarD [Pseudomonas syringae]|uniref:EamA family transporter RarD n=1 Tax=Pseudomonas syringae TaxID=317 RepID=UPI0008962EED|nr:EamA family transporter RarD [Pseudomonas syringae]SDX76333.1 chloramphenicol-sensitive protein RarD [Pseudomonas syringae]SFM83108.1 chloramphenicol-sensitive protein RarD [Pseudomonas syringae]